MISTAFLAALAYFICYGGNLITGQSMSDRPIVAGAVAGALLGNPTVGIILGAALEVVFMGSVNIGGQISADHTAATIFAVVFAANAVMDPEAALTLAVPIGVLMGFVTMFINNVFLTVLVPLIDKYAEEGNEKALVGPLNLGVWLAKNLFFAAVIFAGVYAGSQAVSAFVDSIPEVVMTGLTVCGQLLPAVGLALLMKLIWNKEIGAFYLLGFMAFEYLELPVIAIAIFGIIFVVAYCINDFKINKIQQAIENEAVVKTNIDEVEDFLK